MTRSQTLSLTHALTGYAQGLATEGAAEGINGDLLHLTGQPVPVNSALFEYAEFSANASTQVVDTLISENDPEGPTIDYGGTKREDSLNTNGASSPWYKVEGMTDMEVLNNIKSAARLGTTRMLLSRLNQGITAINASAGAPTAIDATTTTTKVIDLLQSAIDLVRIACGGFCKIHLLWGTAAWRAVQNHTLVRDRTVGGGTKDKPGLVTLAGIDEILACGTTSRLSNAVYNSAKRGQTVSNAFLLSNVVYIAAVSPTPDSIDPGAVKIFKGTGDAMTPKFWAHGSGSHERCKWNWQEKIRVTNAGAIKKQEITV